MSRVFEHIGTFAAMGLLVSLAATSLFAVDSSANAPLNDGIDRTDPNFVKASLLVMGPGGALYACAGHVAFRMECPTYGLDSCYTYESEDESHRVLSFFAGKLNMGMFVMPASKYISDWSKTGRGMRAYELNLPADAKQRLWRLLDEKVAEGLNLPYDYVKRGCAHSVLTVLLQAIAPYRFVVENWPAKFKGSRREILMDSVCSSPWNACFLSLIMGTEADRSVTQMDKVIIPADLVSVLKEMKIGGKKVVSGASTELLQRTLNRSDCFVTPLIVSIVVLLMAFANSFMHISGVDIVLLTLQSLLGVMLAYLVVFSSLPATDWNWLIVPFNPLPLIFWKWRRYWALPFAAVLAGWVLWMIFAQHQMTDWTFVVLAGGLLTMYVGIWHAKASQLKA